MKQSIHVLSGAVVIDEDHILLCNTRMSCTLTRSTIGENSDWVLKIRT
ncbi:MAG: hypothetical protein H0X26_04115 [Alphaproteobacteria bacterium]|nr:hypothetical protein [Alphaproteobacteria bacterium]